VLVLVTVWFWPGALTVLVTVAVTAFAGWVTSLVLTTVLVRNTKRVFALAGTLVLGDRVGLVACWLDDSESDVVALAAASEATVPVGITTGADPWLLLPPISPHALSAIGRAPTASTAAVSRRGRTVRVRGTAPA
jgi:hypothetical protein